MSTIQMLRRSFLINNTITEGTSRIWAFTLHNSITSHQFKYLRRILLCKARRQMISLTARQNFQHIWFPWSQQPMRFRNLPVNNQWRSLLLSQLLSQLLSHNQRHLDQSILLQMLVRIRVRIMDAIYASIHQSSYKNTSVKVIVKYHRQSHQTHWRILRLVHTDVIESIQALANHVILSSQDLTTWHVMKTQFIMHGNKRSDVICARKRRPSLEMTHWPDIWEWYIPTLIGLASKRERPTNEIDKKNANLIKSHQDQRNMQGIRKDVIGNHTAQLLTSVEIDHTDLLSSPLISPPRRWIVHVIQSAKRVQPCSFDVIGLTLIKKSIDGRQDLASVGSDKLGGLWNFFYLRPSERKKNAGRDNTSCTGLVRLLKPILSFVVRLMVSALRLFNPSSCRLSVALLFTFCKLHGSDSMWAILVWKSSFSHGVA